MSAPASEIRPRVPIDPRIRERRTAVVREQGRRRLRVLLALLGVLTLVTAAVGATRSPLLDVDRVEVRGARHTAQGDVVAAAGAADGPQLVDYDTAAARRRIEALPWVLSASVARRWPNTVEVTVVERVAVAAVPARDGWALVDADGRILEVAGDDAGLVAIAAPSPRRRAGQVLPRALRAGLPAAAALAGPAGEGLRPHVKAVLVGGEGSPQLGLQLQGGGTVQLGTPDDLEAKLVAAATVLESVGPAAVDTLDVRVPAAPVLRRPGAGAG